MGVSRNRKLIVLPGGWPGSVKSALLHAISLTFTAPAFARSKAETSRNVKHRLQADLDQARTENALLEEELRIKDARWNRLIPHRRPDYDAIRRQK